MSILNLIGCSSRLDDRNRSECVCEMALTHKAAYPCSNREEQQEGLTTQVRPMYVSLTSSYSPLKLIAPGGGVSSVREGELDGRKDGRKTVRKIMRWLTNSTYIVTTEYSQIPYTKIYSLGPSWAALMDNNMRSLRCMKKCSALGSYRNEIISWDNL